MATRVTNNGDKLLITSSVPNYNSAYTICLWLRPQVLDSLWKYYVLVNRNTGASQDNRDNLIVNLSNELRLDCVSNGAGSNTSASVALTQGDWVHVTMRRNSDSSLEMLANGVVQGSTLTTNVSSRQAATLLQIGMPGAWDSSNGGKAAFSACKIWTAALTDAEILQEMNTIRPIRFADLWAWYPLLQHGDINDYSGSGRNLTAGGTLTTEENPPVGWGA